MSETARHVDCEGSGRDEKNRVEILFGTGKVQGGCVRDSVCLTERGEACVYSDFITSDFETEMPFGLFQFDGVMGLTLPDMSQGSTFNLMQNLINHHTLQHPVFAVYLSDTEDEESKVTFGSHDPSLMYGTDFIWLPVIRHTGYWEVKIQDIAIDNKPGHLCKNCFVAVDTGTSELAGPTHVIENVKKLLDVKEDCSNYNTLPLLGFQLPNNRVLNLEPRDYIDKVGGDCSVTLMNLDVPPPNGPLFVFGIPFLQKFYTVYDPKNRRVGFSVAKHKYVEEEEASKVLSFVQM